jgi:hypothetical protein
MKKAIFSALAVAAAVATFAAFDVTKAPNVIPVVAPQAISAGETNSVTFTARSLKGIGAVVVSADAALGRSMDVTLYTTNAAAGGWTPYVQEIIAETNAFTRMVAFPADGLTFDLELEVGSIGEASTATAFILCY